MWAWSLQILFLVGYALLLKALALQNAPFGETLWVRGLVVMVLAMLLSRRRRWSLVPKNTPFQVVRCLLAGLTLLLSTGCYLYLSASTIALISRLDVFWSLTFDRAALRGHNAAKFRILTFLLSVVLLIGVNGVRLPGDTTLGIIMAVLSTALVTNGYFLARRSNAQENGGVSIFTPGVSLLVFGLAWQFFNGDPFGALWRSSTFVWETLLSGVALFYFFYYLLKTLVTISIYVTNVGALVGTLLILFLEPLCFGTPLSLKLALVFMGLLAICAIPVWLQSRTT